MPYISFQGLIVLKVTTSKQLNTGNCLSIQLQHLLLVHGHRHTMDGYYAGLPGQAYAKILAEQWTNISPTGAYWNPTYVVSDNRLAAFSEDITKYRFAFDQGESVQVHVRLIYRRAYIQLAKQKGWPISDILMEEIRLDMKR